MEKAKKILWLILFLYSFTVEAVSLINEIKYQGNEVTQASVLNREIYISSGDELNVALIEESRQAIMDLGLFKSVHYYIEENDKSNNSGSGSCIDIIFIVEEKYYLLIIPKLKLDDDEIHFGIQLKWDNIFGLNHETRILAEDRGSTNGVNKSRFSFRYFYPDFNHSAYDFGFLLESKNDVDDEDGSIINRQDESYQITISKWLNDKGRSRGLFASASFLYQKRFNQNLVLNSDSEHVNAIVLGSELAYKDVNNFEYNRGGKSYGYKLDFSNEALGSEASFTKHQFYYKSYYRMAKYPASNLNVQMQFGHSNEQVLGEDAFSLGSSDDLRGYENNRFTGNTMFLTNIEYMFPETDYPVFRYVVFIDAGNTYDALGDVFHQGLNIGSGAGLRWKIRSLVKIDLRADIGYGFTDEDYRFSFGTRHAF